MSIIRALIKRNLPGFARDALIKYRLLPPPPAEDVFLHDYKAVLDPEIEPRLTLVIPSIAPGDVFGGASTGIDVFLELGKRTGVQLRIYIDSFERTLDKTIVEQRARGLDLDPERIVILPRMEKNPVITARRSDIFISYTCWIALNVRNLVKQQAALFDQIQKPYMYIMQDYEPQFYPFSSTHMLARLACDPVCPYWGIFNSSELYRYFKLQGHSAEREFVFEPKLSNGLRPFLSGDKPSKERCVLVYGRQYVPRNCFPAIEKGLRAWSQAYPEFLDWEVVSAGLPHEPIPIGPNRVLRSLGKLSLEEYGHLLKKTAVGLSLMSSPHPSYPPLEMAHFGIRTITNSYVGKNLSFAHDNIISINDLAPETIAEALAVACRDFNQSPAAGWSAQSHMPSFLSTAPFPFLEEAADALQRLWAGEKCAR